MTRCSSRSSRHLADVTVRARLNSCGSFVFESAPVNPLPSPSHALTLSSSQLTPGASSLPSLSLPSSLPAPPSLPLPSPPPPGPSIPAPLLPPCPSLLDPPSQTFPPCQCPALPCPILRPSRHSFLHTCFRSAPRCRTAPR
jgi:hypothetical protein